MNAVILAELLNVLRGTLISRSKEADHLNLENLELLESFSQDRDSNSFVSSADQNAKVVERFIYLCSEIQSGISCEFEDLN